MRGCIIALVILGDFVGVNCALLRLGSLWLMGSVLLGDTAGAGERGAVKYACAGSCDDASDSESFLKGKRRQIFQIIIHGALNIRRL